MESLRVARGSNCTILTYGKTVYTYDLKSRYGPEYYTDFLIKFMEQSRKAKKPFLAYYSMALAHDVTDDLKQPVPYMPGKDRWQDYREMAEAMDMMVGKLISALDKMKLRERTLILFSGDNGTASRSIMQHDGKRYIREPVLCLEELQEEKDRLQIEVLAYL